MLLQEKKKFIFAWFIISLFAGLELACSSSDEGPPPEPVEEGTEEEETEEEGMNEEGMNEEGTEEEGTEEEGETPIGEGETPIGEGETPIGEGEAPIGEGETPIGEGEVPLETGEQVEQAPQEEMAATAPMTGDFFSYVVKNGESLSMIARSVYGSTESWQQLANANSSFLANPNLIYPGDVLKVPLINESAQAFSTTQSEQLGETREVSITVSEGDTLSSLAKQHLGDGNQWRTIYTQVSDSISNPDHIMPGQNLTFAVYQ